MTVLETVERLVEDALSTRTPMVFRAGRTRITAAVKGDVVVFDVNGWPASAEAVREALAAIQGGQAWRCG
jgi:hypothetical protein